MNRSFAVNRNLFYQSSVSSIFGMQLRYQDSFFAKVGRKIVQLQTAAESIRFSFRHAQGSRPKASVRAIPSSTTIVCIA
ncbi:uncharacterized protein L969DRAFT_91923 [Mixia osmundae IAM 14324]|uniref:Uncharacterized protein n=1 Tax=Mixia osmundae (strain CBS 9802 / IAM 14324 / JCM 22182 / KY 12970) TaxID=764103 RepID=G7E350_MIXOS|nr:uncharacterized protein L969DRAFT_91923 [Mixia osmundae IAM 14324]KEI42484.1 hypothetical protein L969DRAFT_91923 [Mixia osmundae IAM 14324]GAA97231.1 hypothetical protein E5Q_03907 [Mixia osmundae IAM 14324]